MHSIDLSRLSYDEIDHQSSRAIEVLLLRARYERLVNDWMRRLGWRVTYFRVTYFGTGIWVRYDDDVPAPFRWFM